MRQVSAKTLEGTISALVTAINAERRVRGIAGPPEVEVNNTQFNLSALGVDLEMVDRLPPEQRDRALELQRQQFEIASQLNALAAGDVTIEGTVNENPDHPSEPAEGSGDQLDPPLP
jgi:hypothetical protein